MTEKKRSRADAHKSAKRPSRGQKAKKPKSGIGTIIKRIFLTLIVLGFLGLLAGGGLFAYYASTAPSLDEELLKDPLSTTFYDKDGEIFATIGAENREYVKYEDIPQGMIDAIIATEDSRFFEHHGMDFYRLGGAIVANFTRGFGSEGASTITQQVVKNAFLHNEKRLKRKAQEAWLSFQLERKYTKEEIFEMYFNKVLMSGRTYGFGTASKYFYNKELSELSLAESALLAGMPQAPNGYNPLKYPEEAKKRRNIVLSLMNQHGYISESDMKAAQQAPVTDGLTTEEQRQTFVGSKYEAFLDVALNELEANGDGTALDEGLKVYTTLDPNAQETVENVMNNDALFPTEKIQSGISVIDTQTGAIKAIGGGRNYQFGFNYANSLDRQPGSTIKPIVDYGPAIENEQWSTGHAIVDKPTTYTGTNIAVNNIDMNYLGTLTMRQALYMSRNTTAVQALQEVGTEKAQKFAENLGMKPKNGLVESDALGGGEISTSPVKLAGAYAAFGNDGVYNTPHAIEKIVYRDGVSSKSYKPKSKVAMSDYTAYMITDMLRDVVGDNPGASGTRANIPSIDMAGKTGTTNYSDDELQRYGLRSDSVPETWFAGYSTEYTIAVWSGYEKRSDAMTTWDERYLPQTLFREVMGEIATNPSKFTKPSSVTEAVIEVGSNPVRLASSSTPAEKRRTELFVKGTEPKQAVKPKEKEKDKEKEEALPAPGVSASYDEATNQIAVNWSYDKEGATFELSANGMNITTTSDKAFTFANPGTAESYTISVVAIVDGKRSSPGSATVTVKTETEEPEEPEEPENPDPEVTDPETPDPGTTDPETPDPGDGSGNGTDNGNNQGGGTENGGNTGGNQGGGTENGGNTGGNQGGGTTTPPTNPNTPNPPTNNQ